ncbi:MAG: DUF262 domain-containing protein [Candidatus Poribacteria bacterium]|nr:DUF262 domain-containing protein [Candidatus Poribacteria bacterium]
MHTTEKNIDHLFGVDVQYQVPLYQRRYIWDETNWNTLWDDIRSQAELKQTGGDNRHFVGAIVTRPIEGESRHPSRFEVIDGQQRLATFQIILCAIRDICQSAASADIAAYANHHILNSPIVTDISGTPDARYKFLPTSFDVKAFRAIIAGDQARNGNHLILQAYSYFKSQIVGYIAGDTQKMSGLLSAVVNDFVVIQIHLDSSDKTEKIFESINASGQNLSEFDLLRNNIFLRADVDSNRLYHEYWHFDDDAFWTPETLSQFLRDFLTAKLGIEIETHDLFNLYNQHYRPNLGANQGVEHELAELKQHAEVYREKIEPDA